MEDEDSRPDDLPGARRAGEEPAVPPAEVRFTEVTYTVQRGGTLARVANLYMIPHHEIAALNPKLPLDASLGPGAKIVVHRVEPGVRSQSRGQAIAGSLVDGVPMLEGPGRILKAERWKTWGTLDTVATLDDVLRTWAQSEPDAHPVLVGNLSQRAGGKLPPHGSHQSGRDVDLSYVQLHNGTGPKGDEPLDWRRMDASNLDAERTWKLIRVLLATGRVEAIFIDKGIQKLLHDHAVAHGKPSAAQLESLLEYPRGPGQSRAVIIHVDGHVDHMHVRFHCPSDDTTCVRKPQP